MAFRDQIKHKADHFNSLKDTIKSMFQREALSRTTLSTWLKHHNADHTERHRQKSQVLSRVCSVVVLAMCIFRQGKRRQQFSQQKPQARVLPQLEREMLHQRNVEHVQAYSLETIDIHRA